MSLICSSKNENEKYIICGTLRKPSNMQERVKDEQFHLKVSPTHPYKHQVPARRNNSTAQKSAWCLNISPEWSYTFIRFN